MYLLNRNSLPIHVRESVDCYTRPWKTVEFSQRQYSSSCAIRVDRPLSASIYQQEFEIDREYYSFDESITYKVCALAIC